MLPYEWPNDPKLSLKNKIEWMKQDIYGYQERKGNSYLNIKKDYKDVIGLLQFLSEISGENIPPGQWDYTKGYARTANPKSTYEDHQI